jgi:ribosomal protein S18 acetylase RimI-like enzyme
MFLSEAYVDELVAFTKKYSGKPQPSSAMVRRFLNELISTKELVFDLQDNKGRMALAVLLDKVINPANDSCLEILAARPDVDASLVTVKFIEMAKTHPTMNRSGFQVGFHQDSLISDKDLVQLGLSHYYDTFEMLHSDLASVALEDHANISAAVMTDRDELYKVLCESFAQSPDTSIPDEATWRKNFLKFSKSHSYLYRSNNTIVGFSILIEGEDGVESEIRTLGVLSSARGKGIGKHLLQHSLIQSSKLRFKACRLTVAVKNEKALSMYSHAGFKVVEKFKTFRMNFL